MMIGKIDTDFLETYYEVVLELERMLDIEGSFAERHSLEYGRGGMWELAKNITEEFQEKYKTLLWGSDIYFSEELENFITNFNYDKERGEK